MADIIWITLLLLAGACTGYLALQLYITRQVVRTLQETAIIVTPAARKKDRASTWLLQMVLFGGAIVAAFRLLAG